MRRGGRVSLTERQNNIGLPTPIVDAPPATPQFLHPLQSDLTPGGCATAPVSFAAPAAIATPPGKGKQSLAENSASNNLSTVGRSCREYEQGRDHPRYLSLRCCFSLYTRGARALLAGGPTTYRTGDRSFSGWQLSRPREFSPFSPFRRL